MEATTKKILVWAGVLTGAGATILIIRNVRTKQFELINNYLDNGLRYDNDTNKGADMATNKNIYDLAKKYPGDPSKYLKIPAGNTVGSLVVDFKKSMSGAGTDEALFMKTLGKIKNVYTLQFVSQTYKIANGESLIDAMKGESKIYGILWSAYNFQSNPALGVLLDGTRWNPVVAGYLTKLPEV